MRQRFYVGIKFVSAETTLGATREVFKSSVCPTVKTHGKIYGAVIGPFRTKRGATFMALYGRGNPHCQHVRDAERLAKKEAQGEPPFGDFRCLHVLKGKGVTQVSKCQHELAQAEMARLDKCIKESRKGLTNGKSRSG